MYLLDTNVTSELMRPEPNASVRNWIDAQPSSLLYMSAISLAEILFGVLSKPDGKLKRELITLIDRFERLFDGRILMFDAAVARTHGIVAARAVSAGRKFSESDGYIAATAAHHHFIAVTRDTDPFIAGGVRVINPFED